MSNSIGIAGAGFSGAIIANKLANAGFKVDVFEPRAHVAGNCFSSRDNSTGIMVHKYGPHIFHTDKEHVWQYVNKLASFKPYVNRVKANSGGKIYSLPINLHTINQFFGTAFSPAEAEEFICMQADQDITEPVSFEQQAMKFVGKTLYNAFFAGYTQKQWGLSPAELPASILKRLPLRFNYDDNYFNHQFQGMPEQGYTPIIEKLLNHPNIKVHLQQKLSRDQCSEFTHVFWSGPLDAYFDYRLGRLPYRTLDFREIRATGDYQGGAVVNYCDADVPYTRISEHKHFTPWEQHQDTICFAEYSRQAQPEDEPYYPVRLVNDKQLLSAYVTLAQQERAVTFVGRLGTYRYLDMDVTIDEALQTADAFLQAHAQQQVVPAFIISPL
ncbi:UDP-galactopyranose mutase [Rheinheimera oceanensis]|uniref:UDP-galactopyranose mutase n=1 Tax=Rheinheimera oceanensis TaxID=2817449 RepID=UPI001BFD6EA8|nr:UDP-galactopyranose mutase [Rheinheimera oceanensis]